MHVPPLSHAPLALYSLPCVRGVAPWQTGGEVAKIIMKRKDSYDTYAPF